MMDPKMQARVLDQLAELVGTDDGGRLSGYLTSLEERAKARADAQHRYRERRKASGMIKAQTYLSADKAAVLVALFPGPRKGIDWAAVADAAIKSKEQA
jgi:hypothetical protein